MCEEDGRTPVREVLTVVVGNISGFIFFKNGPQALGITATHFAMGKFLNPEISNAIFQF